MSEPGFSSQVMGHTSIREELERELPPVTLLEGPASSGKWKLAAYLLGFHTSPGSGDAHWADSLTMASAREIHAFSATEPTGPLKVCAVKLDGFAPGALASLLKLLEEPPARLRFILTSSVPLPSTVYSRCHRYRCGLLTVSEVAQVLVSLGIPPDAAQRAAESAGGQVSRAQAALERRDGGRASALAAIRAAVKGDYAGLARAFRGWGPAEHEALWTWRNEARTRCWRVFSPADAPVSYAARLNYAEPGTMSTLWDRAALESLMPDE